MATDEPAYDTPVDGGLDGGGGGETGPGGTGPESAHHDEASPGGAHHDDAGRGGAYHDEAGPGGAHQDDAGPESAHHKNAGRDGASENETPDSEEGEPLEVDWEDLLTQLARQPVEEGWLTLDEASDAAGVSRSTLRSWYRSGQIPSRMVAGVHGPQRLVPLEAVVSRALRSARARRQLEHARSLEAEVAELRRRVEVLERHLGLR